MPTPTKGPRLGGSPAHERLIMANLAQSLFEHGKITTTLAKAKKLRPIAEKLITSAKRGTLHSRRLALRTIRDKDVLHKLFAEIGPSFATREGGYLRITKTMPRKGDNAPMAVIELIREETVSSAASRVARTAASKKAAPAAKKAEAPRAEAAAAESAEEAAVEAAEQAADAPAALVDTAAASDDAAASDQAAASDDAAAGDADADEAVEESASTDEAPYGDGSHAPLEDGSQPDGFPIKGNADSMLYHVPGSAFYDRTVAEVWFASAEAAEAAGFLLPPSQREDEAQEGDAEADA